ncbi:MAG: hypothetical protein FWE80_03945 [Oscillospiraceae bacterium]|nr:hypothetical protein [Oscillospiraceae bacterium]
MERFEAALEAGLRQLEQREGIGRLKEHGLHAVLKFYFQPDAAYHEVKTGNYVADCVADDRIVEIQTGRFYAMRGKLLALLADFAVTVVYPIQRRRRLIWINPETGERSPGRLSPKIGRFSDALPELYWVADAFDNPFFRLHLLLVDVDEHKLLNGYGIYKKLRATRVDRLPTAVGDELIIEGRAGLAALLPELAQPFTKKDFEKATGLKGRNGFNALKLLDTSHVVQRAGKKGNAILYEKV